MATAVANACSQAALFEKSCIATRRVASIEIEQDQHPHLRPHGKPLFSKRSVPACGPIAWRHRLVGGGHEHRAIDWCGRQTGP